MLRVGLGLSESQLHGNQKGELDERYGCSPRHLMQTLGTEWGRDLIDQNIWVNAMRSHMEQTEEFVIIPDVRFESEAEMIREEGILIHVIGPNKIKSSHKSESGIYLKEGDIKILNQGSLDEYYLKLEKLVRKHLA